MDVAFEISSQSRAANMDIKDIIKLTYYLVGEVDTAKRRELVASKLQDISLAAPFVVAALASPIYKVEIEALASIAN